MLYIVLLKLSYARKQVAWSLMHVKPSALY